MLGYLPWKGSCNPFLWSVCCLQDYISQHCFLITVNTTAEKFGGEKIGYFFVVLMWLGFWCLLFPSFSTWVLWVTPTHSLRFWDLHMCCISLPTSTFPKQNPPGLMPCPAKAGQSAARTRYPTMNTNVPCCHSISQLPSWVSLETHTFLFQDSSPMCFSLQCWQTSEAKEPEDCWWEVMKDVPASWSRAEVPKLPSNERTRV